VSAREHSFEVDARLTDITPLYCILRLLVATDQAPEDFIDRPEKYADRLFVSCIKRWPITSLHPFGTLVEELGVIGDIETETNALLKDCNFSAEDFSEAVNKCLPPLPYTIPDRESKETL
jgi:protein SSD1